MDQANEVAAPVGPLDVTAKAPWVEVLPGARRFFAASFVTQLAMLGLFAFAGWLIANRLTAQEVAIAAEQHQSEALGEKVEALATDTQALKAELVNLRQSVASHTGQDVLFLKVLLLKPDIDVRTGPHHRRADDPQRAAVRARPQPGAGDHGGGV